MSEETVEALIDILTRLIEETIELEKQIYYFDTRQKYYDKLKAISRERNREHQTVL